MTTEAEAACTKCGKPMPKAASMTQWIIDPTRCACTSENKREVRVCSLCGLPLRSNSGTITQWIFKSKICTCMHAHASNEFFTDVKMPDNDAIAGNQYHFLSVAAHGGLGTVFKAENIKLGRFVAIKVLPVMTEDTKAAQNFMREAKSSSMLQHPNLLTVLDFGTMSDGRRFLVTEWIDGLTLAQFLTRHGKLSIAQCQELFSQVLDGLSHAHNRGVVHRDIKPSNIMLARTDSGGWFVKIIDFGTAKEFSKDSSVTRAEDMVCSPFYMSPEQGAGSPMDHRSDIYSLGCTLYEALAGKPPFTGRPLSVAMRHQSDLPLSLTETAGFAFPEAMEQVVATLLKKSPSERYQSAEAVKSALLSVQADGLTAAHARLKRSTIPTGRKLPMAWLYVGLITVGLISAIALILLGSEKENANLPIGYMKIRNEFDGQSTQSERALVSDVAVAGHYAETDETVTKAIRLKQNGRLNLFNLTLSEHGLKPLEGVKNIRELNLASSTFPDSALDSIRNSNVEILNLASSSVTDKSIDKLLPLRSSLAQLCLNNTDITDACIPTVSKMTNLDELYCTRTEIHGTNLSLLGALPKLRLLDISNTKINEENFASVGKLKSLAALLIDSSQATRNNLRGLGKLPLLQSLDICKNRVNKIAWSEFKNLRELKKLSCVAPSVNQLSEVSLPANLRSLSLITNSESEAKSIKKELSRKYPQLSISTHTNSASANRSTTESW